MLSYSCSTRLTKLVNICKVTNISDQDPHNQDTLARSKCPPYNITCIYITYTKVISGAGQLTSLSSTFY